MTYPKAIVLATAFITGAIIYVNQPAQSTDAFAVDVRYQIGGGDNTGLSVWAIDTWTGAVVFCAAVAPRKCVIVQKGWFHRPVGARK